MDNHYLLTSPLAVALYERYARELPIIDFHNHITMADVQSNRRFENLTELWLASDPYKHRLMRICGVPERFITGEATPFEKFEKFCEIFPLLAGHPVYDWSRMELRQVFGIEQMPCKETAREIYDRANSLLATDSFTNNAILARFHIEYQSPVAQLTDDLSAFDGKTVAPSLRGDDLLAPTAELKQRLQEITGVEITDDDSYMEAVCLLLDKFAEKGCRFADHALDDGFFDAPNGKEKTAMLIRLAGQYEKRGWTLLLHIGAKRSTSPRLKRIAGPAGGYAGAGSIPAGKIADLLGEMEAADALPKTVLFPLDMADQASYAVLQGSFSQDGVASKVQLGPAWWWCDHKLGIENTLDAIASFGVVSQFIGMTTDSRSLLSFCRHDYFRRILCSWLARQNAAQQWDLSTEMLGQIIEKICYRNAKERCNYGYV